MPAKKIEDLPADAFVLVRVAGADITIESIHDDLSQYYDEVAYRPLFAFKVSAFEDPLTHRQIWRINNSVAVKGFGPLVYDLAMELASTDGRAGLMTGTGLSPDSTRVWDHYVEKRADVGKTKFDAAHPWFSKEYSEKPRPYIDPKYPYLWTKAPDLLPKLHAAGKIIVIKGTEDLTVNAEDEEPDPELDEQLKKFLNGAG